MKLTRMSLAGIPARNKVHPKNCCATNDPEAFGADRVGYFESLETRLLLYHAPWGAVPALVGQDLSAAYFPAITGSGESIVMIDTGVDYLSASLGGGIGPHYKIRAGYNFLNDTSNPFDSDPTDTDGHGTVVAGLLGANSFVYDGYRYQGVAPGANIIVLDVDNGVTNPSNQIIGQALQWVIDYRIHFNIVAVNISEGNGDFYNTKTSESTYGSELAQLYAHGVFIGASSGNSGGDTGTEYPSSDPSVVSVGSVNSSDAISDFTSTGADLDLLAPGEEITSTWVNPSGNATYLYGATGTSFAAPWAVGLAALIKQIEPTYGVARVLAYIKLGATVVTDPESNLSFARLNIYNTLTLVERALHRSEVEALAAKGDARASAAIPSARLSPTTAALASPAVFSTTPINNATAGSPGDLPLFSSRQSLFDAD